MSEFKIPEAAVEAADRAGKEFAETHTMSMFASVADMQRECARRTVQAAFAEALVPAGFTNTEEFRELRAGRGGWVSGLELDGDTITLYTIKETP